MVETFNKYRKIYRDDIITVQEKIDGGNFRFYFKDDGINNADFMFKYCPPV